MLKVKFRHSTAEVAEVYRVLTDNSITIVGTDIWQDLTTCLIKDKAELQRILGELNHNTYIGVSLYSARPTLKTLLRSLTK